MKYCIYDGDDRIEFVLDAAASKGIVRVAEKVAEDFKKVTGIKPEIKRTESAIGLKSEENPDHKSIIMFDINEGSFASQYGEVLQPLQGRRECFAFAEVGDNLVIAGSDRLGTIYGMFELSKLMGVSPLIYWADAAVEKKDRVELPFELPFISKEPSVKFRGYFINDEWPCFGNWTTDHFGGFTAEMYDHVFEFLLRMKGNYLWPAMWSSSFAWDGPGLASYELADEYGIFMGNSHHEPCLRAGEEWTKVNRDDPSYGGAWSVLTNYDGVVRFWRESMEERGGFNSLVTVGMRGERDSTILGENATLADNINVVKTAITAQKEILAEQEAKRGKKYPKMLALYKEVEPFYFGDETAEGLSEWDGLDDVILMLCEDNHNYTRTLSDPAISRHKGGLGMYYHVDYHGGPVSFEWINSTPLSTIWEQMTQAYEFGVKDLWILNVGDVKFNEFPLTYFMELAYDFEKWGSSAPNETDEYTVGLLKDFFGGILDKRGIAKAAQILTETVRLGSLRRPEALTPDTYDLHNGEAFSILKRVDILEAAAEQLYEVIEAEETKRAAESKAGGTGKDINAMDAENSALAAYYSLIYFPAKAMINHIRLNIFAGLNHMYARENRKAANEYADKVEACIRMNKELNEEFAAFKGGKWKGMELEAHIGFTKWNDDGCRYPVIARVIPVDRPRLQVVSPYSERIYDKVYGAPMRLIVDDFCYPGNKETTLSLCNVGVGEVGAKIIVPECSWLKVEPVGGSMKAAQKQGEERFKPDQGLRDEYFETRGEIVIEGSIENEQDIRLIFDRDAFEKEILGRNNSDAKDSSSKASGNEKNVASLIFRITGSEGTAVEVEVRAAAEDNTDESKGSVSQNDVTATSKDSSHANSPVDGLNGKNRSDGTGKAVRAGMFGFDIPVDRFYAKETPEGSDILILDDYGRNGTAVKALPVTKTYERGTEPVTEYRFICEDDGEYEIALHLAPANPPVRGSLLLYGFAVGDAPMEYFNSVSKDYKGGENSCPEWTKAAVLRERVMTHKVLLKKGETKVRFGFCEPGIVLERIRIRRA
ncbi:MAG: glycosyl hydrolase 115 family protein [Lachnospiraceae bacterium]|nr:glycosyl hydrolase 115 family protein [Lachnospiraceae bacterium]